MVNDDAWRDANEPVSAGPHPVLLQRPVFGWVVGDVCLVRISVGSGVGSIDHFNEPIEAPLDSGNRLARRVAFDACQAFFFFCCQLVAK